MKHTLFLTGYPGFLTGCLIHQLSQDHYNKIEHIYLLVLPEQEQKAKSDLTCFIKQNKLQTHYFSILTGDITKEDLGIEKTALRKLKDTVTHVFHLAAIYDLAVPQEIAFQVNVHGTKMVNEWVKELKQLQRYIYFSTAYVSGTREGIIYETELRGGQSFKNHYEATKYEAELLVEGLKETIPTTIIRPGIVKGHSKTGITSKFDGMYFMLNLLDKLAFSPFLPYLGAGRVEGNFVPSDYVIKATSYLSFAAHSIGKTYHLTDPSPYHMRDLYKMLAEAYLMRTPKGEVPLDLVSFIMQSHTTEKWLKVEREALAYFTLNVSYDCTQATRDLEGSGVYCPDMKDTIEPMITFYRKYKHDENKHIAI